MTASQHKWPAIHNAMWPGLVGKGPDSEPPIDLETMLDLTAGAASNGLKFDGVDLFLFDPHVSIDSTDDDLEKLARQARGARVRRRIARRPGVAAHRRRRRDGHHRRPHELPDAGPQGVRDRQETEGPGHSSVRRRPHRLGVEPERVGDGSRRQHEEDRRHVRRGVRHRRRATASGSPRKARSAGAACTAGSA